MIFIDILLYGKYSALYTKLIVLFHFHLCEHPSAQRGSDK